MTGHKESQPWTGGVTYVFQGTVAEDATAGTHVCTATFTPGKGNEFEVLYGRVVVGNTATAQVSNFFITDGTNILVNIAAAGASGTTASAVLNFPTNTSFSTAGCAAGAGTKMIVSGTMQFVLQISTTAVSVTQTFALVARCRAQKPTAVLADTVGTPTLTTNTDRTF